MARKLETFLADDRHGKATCAYVRDVETGRVLHRTRDYRAYPRYVRARDAAEAWTLRNVPGEWTLTPR